MTRNTFPYSQVTSTITKALTIAFIMSLAIGMIAPASGLQSNQAASTTQEPIKITDWNDLAAIGDSEQSLTQDYVLATDLTPETEGYGGNGTVGVVLNENGELRNGIGFMPLGKHVAPFNGEFNGNHHTISGLRINESSSSLQTGLFSALGTDASVTNITLSEVSITGGTRVGAVTGIATGATINNTQVHGSLSGDNYVGSVTGLLTSPTESAQGLINNATVNATVTGTTDTGGIVGDNDGSIVGTTGTLTVHGNDTHIGGTVGINNGLIYNSTFTTTVVIDSGSVTETHLGGIAGQNTGGIKNVSVQTSVSGQFTAVGGIAGTNSEYGIITQTTVSGSVEGRSSVGGIVGSNAGTAKISQAHANASVSEYAPTSINGIDMGGVVGSNTGTIVDTHFDGNVSGSHNVGGLAGENSEFGIHIGTINTSYTTAHITSDNPNVTDPVIGNQNGGATTYGLYWDVNTTELTDSKYVDDSHGLLTEEMQGVTASKTMTEFAFNDTWVTATGYPALAYDSTAESTPSPPKINGSVSKDIDGDGLYEDVNGDGELTIQDAYLLFTHRNNSTVTKHAQYFNFDGETENTVTLEDVNTLYTMIISTGP